MTRWFPPPSRPRPADGIRARSRRGEIGETWWSRRFIDVLEAFDLGARLTRGRRYARAGQVLELVVDPGIVRARVQGSRRRPYDVRIETLTLSDKDWARVEAAMAARALFLAKLLAGEMPRDIEQTFAETRLSLFPGTERDLATDCSCPDWANPCKHIAAVYYLLAEAFDADPFLIFRWRGRTRDELLERLRARRVGMVGAERSGERPDELWDVPRPRVPPLAERVDAFWSAGEAMDEPPPRPVAAVSPDTFLRTLEPGVLTVGDRPLAEVLAPAYQAIARLAEARGLEDEAT
jgi:uncharacterized Zn finger protein